MRDHFSEFYSPSKEQFDELLAGGLIVLDANVLLDLYRTPTDARGQFLEILERVKDRLWIPYQAGLEFHRNRAKVISDKGKNISEILSTAAKSFSDIKNDVTALDIDKYGLGIESKPLLAELEQVQTKLSEAIGKIHDAQLEMAKSDPIQEKLFDLYAEKVGPGPKDQAELTSLIADGEKRYEDKIPPGYEDQGKSKNPNDAYFFHNGIKYERRFGDLIFWRQIIAHLKTNKCDKVILVSSEKKEDWWRILDGKRFGPHPELIQEMRREAEVSIFWMYPPDQFMRYAAQQANVDVSETALAEVRNAGTLDHRVPVQSASDIESDNYVDHLDDITEGDYPDENEQFVRASRDAAHRWVQQYFRDAQREFYPDIVINAFGQKIGFETVAVRSASEQFIAKQLANSVENVNELTENDGFDRIYYIVVAEAEAYENRFRRIAPRARTLVVRAMLRRIISNIGVDGIYFGIKHPRNFSLMMFVGSEKGGISDDVVTGILASDAR